MVRTIYNNLIKGENKYVCYCADVYYYFFTIDHIFNPNVRVAGEYSTNALWNVSLSIDVI